MTRPYTTPVVSTADATLKVGSGYIHWITISNTHATESVSVQLEDTGTDKWSVVVETSADRDVLPFHAGFDPPIQCLTGIFVDIQNGTPLVTVGIS